MAFKHDLETVNDSSPYIFLRGYVYIIGSFLRLSGELVYSFRGTSGILRCSRGVLLFVDLGLRICSAGPRSCGHE